MNAHFPRISSHFWVSLSSRQFKGKKKKEKKNPENEEMQNCIFFYSKCTQSEREINIVKANKPTELLRSEW